MTLVEAIGGLSASTDSAKDKLGERYLLPHPAEYVIVPSGTVHLRKPGARRTLCGTLIPLDGPRMARYATAGQILTCGRCGVVVEKAGDRWAKGKRAK